MKHKREIIESKYPPKNNEDIWLKDLLLYASTTKGWLPLGSEKTYSNKTELLKDTPTGGTIGIDKETGIAYLYNDVSKEWTPVGGGGGGMTETTWQELKDLRDNSQLTPGSLYRITDYVNTTNVTFDDFTSHQFDIILLALTPNTLAEEGWAAMHDNIYDVTFNDGVTKKCYIYTYHPLDAPNATLGNIVDIETLLGIEGLGVAEGDEIEINEDNKTAIVEGASDILTFPNLTYNDFQNTNFATWKIWYSLDNNTARFSWADDSVEPIQIKATYGNTTDWCTRATGMDMTRSGVRYYGWRNGGSSYTYVEVYTTTETPTINDKYYTYNGPVAPPTEKDYIIDVKGGEFLGKGTIYRITDESGNVCKLQWNELKTIRDSKALVADTKYRIVDYQCTTVQENTQSAGHQFDIVLLALSEDKLAEEGWAMIHDGVDMFDDYDIYTITFNDGVSKQCYYKVIPNPPNNSEHRIVDTETFLGFSLWHNPAQDGFVINTENKTATNAYISSTEFESYLQIQYSYNYFQNSNLSAWKVWYCLDNDKSRFAWADDSVDEGTPSQISIRWGGGGGSPILHATCIRNSQYDTVVSDINYYCFKADGYPNKVYTRTETPSVNDSVFEISSGGLPPMEFGTVESYTPSQQGTGPNGRGVIYRLIDEWNNDVGYDFKNIQFVRKITDVGLINPSTGTNTWVYTFSACNDDTKELSDYSITCKTFLDDVGDYSLCYENKIKSVTSISGSLYILNDVVFYILNVPNDTVRPLVHNTCECIRNVTIGYGKSSSMYNIFIYATDRDYNGGLSNDIVVQNTRATFENIT